ncbi:DNA-binding transcriptional regulator AraC [compost metagenome]
MYFASSAFTRTILSHAAHSGLPAEHLRQQAGISAGLLDDPRQRVPALLVERLWAGCERVGDDPAFGCELVNGMATHCLQGLNILLDSAPSLEASLRCFTRYLPEVTNYVAAELDVAGPYASLALRPAQEPPHHFGLDAAVLSLARNIARRVGLAPAELFERVLVTRRQHCGRVLEDWGVAVEYAEQPCLVLAREALDLPLPGANPFLHQSLSQHWQGGAPETGDGLQLARHWLKAGDQPIEHIADRLGYRQPSNFIRAFRKRFGITPKQFRLSSQA